MTTTQQEETKVVAVAATTSNTTNSVMMEKNGITAVQESQQQPEHQDKQHTFRKRRLSLPMHHLSVDHLVPAQEAHQERSKNGSYEQEHPPPNQLLMTTTVQQKQRRQQEEEQRQQHHPLDDDTETAEVNNAEKNLLGNEPLEETAAVAADPTEQKSAAPAAAPAVEEEENAEKNLLGYEPQEEAAADSPEQKSAAEQEEEEMKAHTFRKRRLSLTTTHSKAGHHSSSHEHPDEDALGADNDGDTRCRRTSMDSVASSVGSIGSNLVVSGSSRGIGSRHRFISRTVHAGELVGPPGVAPPSPAINVDNVLYQQTHQQQQPPLVPPPFLQLNSGDTTTTAETSASHHPKWKRRKTVNLETEHHKLPFSADIVGTYSCHGVEPVYGSEYDEEEEEVEEPEDDNPAAALMYWSQQQQQQQTNSPQPPTSPPADTNTTTTAADGEDPTADIAKQPEAAAAALMASPDTTTTTTQSEPPPVTVAKINQDRGGIAFPYGNCPKTALFAVYDGHGQGGELVSQFALHEIQRRLEKHGSFKKDLEKAFKETFLSVDASLRNEPLIDPLFAGTTACVALLQDNVLTLANAGDSRAVCARQTSTSGRYLALELTADQNPDVPEEMERVLQSGGYVSLPPAPGLSARVWLDPNCTQIGLAMARSIGDHAVSTVGVIAEPVVTTHQIEPDDDFLILASDGVWEFIDSPYAVQIVGDNLHRGATKACQALIEAAAARWHEEEGAYRDDITAIVVRLQDLWKGANMSSVRVRKDSVASSTDGMTDDYYHQ